MSVNVLEAGRLAPPIARDPGRDRPKDDFRPFAGVATGVAAGSLVWLGLVWIFRSLT